MKIVTLICCLVLAYARADVKQLSKTYLPAKIETTTIKATPLCDVTAEATTENVSVKTEEAIAEVLPETAAIDAFLQTSPKQSTTLTETEIASTSYFPCAALPQGYPCIPANAFSGIGGVNYPGQGGFPIQGGFPSQGGFPGQGGFSNQGLFPSQAYFPNQGGLAGPNYFPGNYQANNFPGTFGASGPIGGPNFIPQQHFGQSYGGSQFGISFVPPSNLGPQIFPGQSGGFGVGANFDGRPGFTAGAGFPGGPNVAAGGNFVFNPLSPYQNARPFPNNGFYTDSNEAGESVDESNIDIDSPISRSASDTKYAENGGYVYEKPKIIATL